MLLPLQNSAVKDNSMASYLTATNDASSVTEFGFVDPYSEEDFRLEEDSPLRDQGVDGPYSQDFDIVGTPRDDGMPDIGAYEFQFISSVRPEIGDASLLRIEPNPASSFTQIYLEHGYQGEVSMRIHNVLGQLIRVEQWQKESQETQFTLNTNSLTPGIYEVSLLFNDQIISKKLVKE